MTEKAIKELFNNENIILNENTEKAFRLGINNSIATKALQEIKQILLETSSVDEEEGDWYIDNSKDPLEKIQEILDNYKL